ncbi:MAG TPA: hypothetical protein VK021_11740 [Flavobacteriaceae bacterium]|nr:hypothetical protein [Flavobacteriaceae bacterium]
MTATYSFNKALEQQIKDHLWRVADDYKPPLHTYVDIDEYAKKLASSAIRLEYFSGENLIGLMAGYYNVEKQFLFITNFSLERVHRGQGMELVVGLLRFLSGDHKNISPEIQKIGSQILTVLAEDTAPRKPVVKTIHTEVRNDNQKLISFYEKLGFKIDKIQDESTYLIIDL